MGHGLSYRFTLCAFAHPMLACAASDATPLPTTGAEVRPGSAQPSAATSAEAPQSEPPKKSSLKVTIESREVTVGKVFAFRLPSADATQLRLVESPDATCATVPNPWKEGSIGTLIVSRFFTPGAPRAWAIHDVAIQLAPGNMRVLSNRSQGPISRPTVDKSGTLTGGAVDLDLDDHKLRVAGTFEAEVCPEQKAIEAPVENKQEELTLTYEGTPLPIRGAILKHSSPDSDDLTLSTSPIACTTNTYGMGDVQIRVQVKKKTGGGQFDVDGDATENSFQNSLQWKGKANIQRRGGADQLVFDFDIDGAYGKNTISLKGVAKPRLCP